MNTSAFYDKIRITFNNNNKYISELKEIYDQLGDINKYFGFTPFSKKEWTMILNDLILTYPNVGLSTINHPLTSGTL